MRSKTSARFMTVCSGCSRHVLLAGAWLMLSVGPLAAATPVQLAEDPALSPDGQTLAFSYRGDIWSVSATGGTAVRLTWNAGHDADPHFSPDGKSLAFVSDRSGSRQVYLMPIEGGAPRQITSHTEGYAIEDWYPDGRALLVSGSRDHFWRNSQRFFRRGLGKSPVDELLFDAYASDAHLAPSGQKLLFVREGERWWRKGYRGSRAAQVWLWDFASEQFSQVLKLETECRTPLWKPDESGFYFVSNQSGAFNLWAYDLQKESSRQLTRFEDDSVVMPTLSRDGKTLVFRHLFDLYRLSLEKKRAKPAKLEIRVEGDFQSEDQQRRMLTSAEEVAFTDDGLEIAFIAGGDVWVMDTELKEPRQVTDTPEHERSLVFTPDHQTLLFVSAPDGQPDIYSARRSDPDKYWWQNTDFELKQLTDDAANESQLALTPDGQQLAYVRERGDLWLMHLEKHKTRQLFAGFSAPDYDFSPDSRWIVYAQSDDNFNRDVWIASLDGKSEPVNVSRHPDNEANPVWSPDGTLIAFTGRRVEEEVDIYYLWLQESQDERTSRDRTLEKALKKLQKSRQNASEPGQGQAGTGNDPESTEKKNEAAASKQGGQKGDVSDDSDDKSEDEKQDEDVPEVRIDFERIHERLHRLSIPDSSESNLIWAPKDHRLAFSAEIDGKSGTYTVEIPEALKPKLLSTTRGSHGRWLKKTNAIVWLASGKPASLAANGSTTAYDFTAYQRYLRSARFQAAFDTSWRVMRDWWYDGNFNNRNWAAIRRKYRDMAAQVPDLQGLATVIQLMLGELNGSHLGFYARSADSDGESEWSVETVHLGVRFDSDFPGPGWKIRDVIPDGPADRTASRLQAGDVIRKVDGRAVDPGLELSSVLNGRLDRDVRLTVQDSEGEEREVVLRPIRYSSARELLYHAWRAANRETVDSMSDGTLGYLHIRAMNWSSFLEFERELYAVGYGKQGLVIDVRDNGGGFTTDHLLTALTQPRHAITVPRGGGPGYPQDRMVYASWSKPIVVLCNQNSFSNAEIFSHAIKGLKRGRLVGVPTAGGVISTGAARIMDVGILRRPFRGWFVKWTGQDMELNGAVPHIVKWPEPGQIPAGKDVQLEAAVKALLVDVKKWNAQPRPELIKASERE